MSATLQAGNSISHYRVISHLGAGGMGEVYMAQDETLERAVALKILPPELVKNEERLRRFVQEARSASSLSHPHIITIYEIGQAPVVAGVGTAGSDASPIHFIAMELITGETLRQKIHGDRQDLRTLLRYMAQVAEGLAKAHAAGIIHRDLKPENIMITRDGYAKVLDFGLAKLTERQDAGEDASSMPTATRNRTHEGAVMGTANYMSPEQVQGRVVDQRTDVFSFGAILYEAATRRRPFAADSEIETMHRILHDRPTPVEEINPQAPNALRRIIRRCLAKAPDERPQSMRDLSLEINELVEEFDQLATASSRGSSGSGSSPAFAAPAPKSRALLAGIAAAVVLGLGGIGFGLYALRQQGAAPSTGAPFQAMRMTRITSSGNVTGGRIAPDGKYVVYAVEGTEGHSLRIRHVATGSDVQIVPPLPTPFRGGSFSPDGNYVYYVNQETGGPGYSYLYQVPVLGGTSRKLLFDIDTAASFSPDGRRFAFMRGYPDVGESALMVAEADGTGERKLSVRKDPAGFTLLGPAWSPDGRRIAAVAFTGSIESRQRIVLVDAADGREIGTAGPGWFDVNGLHWLPDGSALAVAASDRRGSLVHQVWLVPYPDGAPRRVTNDLNDYADVSVTDDGATIATTLRNYTASLWVAPGGDASLARRVAAGTGREDSIREMTSAGSGALVVTAPQGETMRLWRIGTDGSNRVDLTPGAGIPSQPAASSDGSVLAIALAGDDPVPHIFVMDGDGGNLRQVTHGETGEQIPALSPDGRVLVHAAFGDRGLHRVDLATGASQTIADDLTGGALISPDGRFVAYDSFVPEGGRLQRMIAIIPASGGAPTIRIPWPDGFVPRWPQPGDAITYARTEEGVGNIWRQPIDGGTARPITHFTSERIFDHDWSPDGGTLYVTRGAISHDIVLVTNFR